MKRSLGALAGALLAAASLGGCDLIHPDNYKSEAEVHEIFADKTILYYTSGVGRQVEYYSPDGQAYLWVGKNEAILRGQWKAGEGGFGTGLCFRYEPYKYNPITGVDRSKWRCTSASMLHGSELDRATGDVLGLAEMGRTPFAMASEAGRVDSLEELRGRLPHGS